MKVAVSHLAFVLGTVKIMVGHFHRLAKVCVVDSVIPHVHEPYLPRPKYDVIWHLNAVPTLGGLKTIRRALNHLRS